MIKITLHTTVGRNPKMVTSNIDGEIVMMGIDQGEYYGLDEIGSRIWELIETPIRVEQLIDALVNEFDVDKETCISDTFDFLNNLVEKNIVLTQ